MRMKKAIIISCLRDLKLIGFIFLIDFFETKEIDVIRLMTH